MKWENRLSLFCLAALFKHDSSSLVCEPPLNVPTVLWICQYLLSVLEHQTVVHCGVDLPVAAVLAPPAVLCAVDLPVSAVLEHQRLVHLAGKLEQYLLLVSASYFQDHPKVEDDCVFISLPQKRAGP